MNADQIRNQLNQHAVELLQDGFEHYALALVPAIREALGIAPKGVIELAGLQIRILEDDELDGEEIAWEFTGDYRPKCCPRGRGRFTRSSDDGEFFFEGEDEIAGEGVRFCPDCGTPLPGKLRALEGPLLSEFGLEPVL